MVKGTRIVQHTLEGLPFFLLVRVWVLRFMLESCILGLFFLRPVNQKIIAIVLVLLNFSVRRS